jgi:hypothetical protein
MDINQIKQLHNKLLKLYPNSPLFFKIFDEGLGMYSWQVCFRDYMYPESDQDYLEWYNDQRIHWDGNKLKSINELLS